MRHPHSSQDPSRPGGTSDESIYAMAASALRERGAGGSLVDVGCGRGGFWAHAGALFEAYVGVDAVAHQGFPSGGRFVQHDLDAGPIPLPDACADVAAALETIEHVENPRALTRELARLARPGGWVLITTPNILSLLGLATLACKRRFAHFQDVDYPAHITPVLEIDLRRMAQECGLSELCVRYSGQGRLALTPRHYPGWLSRLFPAALSDNLLLIGRRP